MPPNLDKEVEDYHHDDNDSVVTVDVDDDLNHPKTLSKFKMAVIDRPLGGQKSVEMVDRKKKAKSMPSRTKDITEDLKFVNTSNETVLTDIVLSSGSDSESSPESSINAPVPVGNIISNSTLCTMTPEETPEVQDSENSNSESGPIRSILNSSSPKVQQGPTVRFGVEVEEIEIEASDPTSRGGNGATSQSLSSSKKCRRTNLPGGRLTRFLQWLFNSDSLDDPNESWQSANNSTNYNTYLWENYPWFYRAVYKWTLFLLCMFAIFGLVCLPAHSWGLKNWSAVLLVKVPCLLLLFLTAIGASFL